MASVIPIRGMFTGSDRKHGDFTPDDRPGTTVAYDFTVCSFVVGSDVIKVRLPKDVHDHPFIKGQEYEVEVMVFGAPKFVLGSESLTAAWTATRGEVSEDSPHLEVAAG